MCPTPFPHSLSLTHPCVLRRFGSQPRQALRHLEGQEGRERSWTSSLAWIQDLNVLSFTKFPDFLLWGKGCKNNLCFFPGEVPNISLVIGSSRERKGQGSWTQWRVSSLKFRGSEGRIILYEVRRGKGLAPGVDAKAWVLSHARGEVASERDHSFPNSVAKALNLVAVFRSLD